jgi:hypothetical protein
VVKVAAALAAGLLGALALGGMAQAATPGDTSCGMVLVCTGGNAKGGDGTDAAASGGNGVDGQDHTTSSPIG